ncbi:unnamed protein product [Prorocentrum cordatum]|uniref:Rhomboid-like protein n=1 Tax=Prorocentrum cordatum TaxID=2364126 RepID=A0ABN9RJS0_9DINO|nr:unnamed protein product [Polarella glacialis]
MELGLQIITHSRPLVHFLGCGAGDADTQDVFRGDCFLRHVTESDQQRFQEFLAATSAVQPEGGDALVRATGAPASIQMSLRSRRGGHVPVELFVVPLPDLDDALGFLMGILRIRETGALPLEARVDAPGAVALLPRAAIPGEAAGSPPSRAAPGGPPPCGPANDRTPSGTEAAAHTPPGPDAEARSSRRPCSSSSGSSASRSSCSSGRRAAAAAGVQAVSLRVDSASPGRCQNLMHAREYYCEVEEADCSMGALNLLCNGDAFLSAASAVLAAASPEPESEEDDDFDVLIRMQGLSKLWAPWAGAGASPSLAGFMQVRGWYAVVHVGLDLIRGCSGNSATVGTLSHLAGFVGGLCYVLAALPDLGGQPVPTVPCLRAGPGGRFVEAECLAFFSIGYKAPVQQVRQAAVAVLACGAAAAVFNAFVVQSRAHASADGYSLLVKPPSAGARPAAADRGPPFGEIWTRRSPPAGRPTTQSSGAASLELARGPGRLTSRGAASLLGAASLEPAHGPG